MIGTWAMISTTVSVYIPTFILVIWNGIRLDGKYANDDLTSKIL